MKFRWLGVAGLELQAGEGVIAIDPFFTRPPFRRVWLGRVWPNRSLVAEKIGRCDAILISHAHYDHLMDVPEVVKNTGAVALGSENACRLLALLGVPQDRIVQIHAGSQVSSGPFQVEVLPSAHIRLPGFSPGPLQPGLRPPLRLRDYRMDASYGFLIQAAGLRLLIWSSEHSEPAPPAGILFLGLTRKKAYLERLLAQVQPRLLVPIHWDDLFRPLSKPMRPSYEPRLGLPPLRRMNLEAYRRDVEAVDPGVRVIIPRILYPYDCQSILG